jgi:hypothetical protein
MKKTRLFNGLLGLFIYLSLNVFAQEKVSLPPNFQPDTRIDNMGYWSEMARLKLVPVQPFSKVPPAVYTGSKVYNKHGVLIGDSPDVPVTTTVTTQSENSIVLQPNDTSEVLNSNNETSQPSSGSTNGADWYHSLDGGETWSGSNQGAGANNSGDPAACINIQGRYFIGFIDAQYGQSVAYSDDDGTTWTVSKVATGSMLNMLDKNHLWVDNGPASPYNGRLYDGYMKNSQITVNSSNNNGSNWSSQTVISTGTNAGSHNQGENFKTGPNGEVYCVWSVYDSWPGDEKALGFSKSMDGGVNWSTATRILNNIRGIRTTGVSQNQRVNSFPSMTCDLSNSPYHGTLYVAWPNIGVPGTNAGSDVDVYVIKSSDGGTTWSAPIRVNQDPAGLGKKHYMSWITCDQANGIVSVVYYDNRNLPANQAEAWVSYSMDGGTTWQDIKVSDVAWTPAPIPNMATGYMGDYLGIAAYDGKVYPCWTDNRLGYAMTYVSPIYVLIPQATVVYQSNILDDAQFGNNDGKMDHGETELLGLTLKNTGNAAGDSVVATLSSSSPYITMEDSTEFYGDFAVNQVKTIQDAYKFHVSDSVPGMSNVPFDVTTLDKAGHMTTSTFTITAHGPALNIIKMTVADPTGNNNGRLDPGENATLTIETKNPGDYDAVDAFSELSTDNPYVTILNPIVPLGTIPAGQSVNAVFNVRVNSAAYIGSAAVFHNYAHAGFQIATKDFRTQIGLIVEDWETGNFSKFPWYFAGDANWAIDPVIKEEGNYSSKASGIDSLQTAKLKINYHVMYDDTISFYRKTATRRYSGTLRFYIDSTMIGIWSGSNNWTRFAYPILAGPHTLTWEYARLGGNSADTAVWTDFIVFPPEYRLAVNAGDNDTTCIGQVYQLNGLSMNYSSVHWTTAGTGTFNDPNILTPIYTPSSQDYSAGSVVLTLHASDTWTPDTTSSMTLYFAAAATASTGGAASICANATYTPENAAATNYSSVHWTSTGDGTYNNPNILHPEYTPGPADKTHGSVKLVMSVGALSICPPAQDTALLTLHSIPAVHLGKDTSICANVTYTLDATTAGAVSYHWLPTGQTTAQITVDSTGIGIGSRTFIAEVTDANSCTGRDTVKVTFKSCTGIQELSGVRFSIYPNPSQGEFTLSIQADRQETLSIRVLSAGGSEVWSARNVDVDREITRKISLSDLAQGSYFIEVSNGSGKLVQKLVIRK